MKLMSMLEEIFNMASGIAKGEVQYQIVDGKPAKITLKQRQMWARIAAYTAQVMNAIANSFDEREIDEMLGVLERAVQDVKAKMEVKESTEERGEESETEAKTEAHEVAEGDAEEGEA